MLVGIRTDSSELIGSGHVMRCLALAGLLFKRGARVVFFCGTGVGNLNELILQRGFEVKELKKPDREYPFFGNLSDSSSISPLEARMFQLSDARETCTKLDHEVFDWLVVDHYGLGEIWEKELRAHTKKIMVIDDLANRPHDCDVLLDQGVMEDQASRYRRLVSPSCTTLFGPKYVLLRDEFCYVGQSIRCHTGVVRRIIIFFGASDLENFTDLVLDILSEPVFSHIVLDIVLGGANKSIRSITERAQARGNAKVHIQIDYMAELMSQADLMVGAGGSSTWERLHLGVPGLVVILSSNQRLSAEWLHTRGYHRCVGDLSTLTIRALRDALIIAVQDSKEIRRMSNKGRLLVDGKGTERVTSILANGIRVEEWTVRQAKEADSELLWIWANDNEVRASSHSQEKIDWADHQKWYLRKLHDPLCYFFIVCSDLGPIGQVRLEVSGNEAILDYSIGQQFRNMGLGATLLRQVIPMFCRLENSNQMVIRAEVKFDNVASMKALERAGFRRSHSNRQEVGTYLFRSTGATRDQEQASR